MTDQLTLRIPNDLGQLRRVRERVEAFGERNELASEIVFKVKLAIEEVLTNTIVHGYSDQDEHTIDMRLDLRPDRLNVTITDDATAFDPRDAKIPDTEAPLEDRTEGGGVSGCILGATYLVACFHSLVFGAISTLKYSK